MRLSLSSSHHLHHIYILYTEALVRKCSWKLVFFKIWQISQEDTWVGSPFNKFLLQITSGGCFYLSCFSWMFPSFTSPLQHFHYFLTVLLLSSFEETLSPLCHYYYMINIIIGEWFIRITANDTTYCTGISMIDIRVSALMQFILKQTTKKP